jgi:hypothetical protein
MTDKGDYHGSNPSDPGANMPVMSTSTDSGQVGERRALTLVPALSAAQPWYAAPLAAPAPDRRALEDEHTRILAQAVGDHLPYELALRAGELAAQLQRTS